MAVMIFSDKKIPAEWNRFLLSVANTVCDNPPEAAVVVLLDRKDSFRMLSRNTTYSVLQETADIINNEALLQMIARNHERIEQLEERYESQDDDE